MQHRLGSKGRVWQGGYNPLKQMCGAKPLSLSAKNTTQAFSCLAFCIILKFMVPLGFLARTNSL